MTTRPKRGRCVRRHGRTGLAAAWAILAAFLLSLTGAWAQTETGGSPPEAAEASEALPAPAAGAPASSGPGAEPAGPPPGAPDGPPREKLLPGLLLGLLLALAALHLARQVYEEAPGSLAASGLLVAAFVFEYVAFGLHTPFVGTGRAADILEALARVGLALALLSFTASYLRFVTLQGLSLWGTRGLLALGVLAGLLAPFNALIALRAAEGLLVASLAWSIFWCMRCTRAGEEEAGFLTPGFIVVLLALIMRALTDAGLIPEPVPADALGHGAFVIGFLLIAFAVESAGSEPKRAYLALAGPLASSPPAEQPAGTVAGSGESAAARGVMPYSERRLALALAASGHGLWDLSVPDRRLQLSPESETLLGLAPGVFDGSEEAFLDCLFPEDRDVFRDRLAELVAGGEQTFSLPFRILAGDGSLLSLQLDGACLNARGTGTPTRCIGLIWALPAPLPTRAAGSVVPPRPVGRHALIEALDQRLARLGQGQGARAGALVVLDLDRFHRVNESFGHRVGDEVLDRVAERIEADLEPGETLLRLGGDEFAVLVNDDPAVRLASERADRVLAALSRPIALAGGREVYVSASLGYVPLTPQTASGEAALRDAEAALYHVKGGGGGRPAGYQPDMHEARQGSALLEADLRRALEREEIELHYQPIMSLADDRVAGFEALLRWRHPERGVLVPEHFVDLAEDTGLIIPLGRYALMVASVQLYQWQTFFPLSRPLFVCVNVSSRQLIRHDLALDVREALAAARLAPHSLRLEVTEELVTADTERARSVLDEIKALGAGIALDDFGKGRATLGSLGELPFDTLKVDRAFVARLREPGEGHVIVRSIVDLAHQLGMDVIAEGIESAEDVITLREMGCEFGQGYHYGPPLPAGEVQTFIAKNWSN